MYDHHIAGMADKVLEGQDERTMLLIDHEDLKKSLKEYWDDYAVHVWSVADVIGVAAQNSVPMSKEKAKEILGNMEGNIDSEFGLTWETVKWHVTEFGNGFPWEEMSNEEMVQYEGFFLLKWIPKDKKLQRCKVLAEKDKFEVSFRGEDGFQEYHVPVTLLQAYNYMLAVSERNDCTVDMYCILEGQIDNPCKLLTEEHLDSPLFEKFYYKHEVEV